MKRFSSWFWSASIICTVVLVLLTSVINTEKYDFKMTAAPFYILGHSEKYSGNDGFSLALDLLESENAKEWEKAGLVSMIELDMGSSSSLKSGDAATKRTIATSFGETDLRYHFKLKTGNFVPTTLDFSTNILYNVSYILNTPSKLIHNIKLDLSISENGLFKRAISSLDVCLFILLDVLHAISGVGLALVMAFLGCILGLVFHPIQSLINFFPSIWQVLVTTWHAISYIFNIFK
ncbi:hypothetical protein [Paenibacillus marinisediminis]